MHRSLGGDSLIISLSLLRMDTILQRQDMMSDDDDDGDDGDGGYGGDGGDDEDAGDDVFPQYHTLQVKLLCSALQFLVLPLNVCPRTTKRQK